MAFACPILRTRDGSCSYEIPAVPRYDPVGKHDANTSLETATEWAAPPTHDSMPPINLKQYGELARLI